MGNELSDRKEEKYWKVIKWVPAMNVAYGFVRGIVYLSKKKYKQALDSAIAVCGGTFGIAAGFGVCLLIDRPLIGFLAWLVHFGLEMLAASTVQNFVIGSGNIWLMTLFEQLKLKNLSSDQLETLLYDEIFRDIAGAGAVYSVFRAIAYDWKRKPEESHRSGWSAFANATGSLIGLFSAAGLGNILPKTLGDDFGRVIAFWIQRIFPKSGLAGGAIIEFGLRKSSDKMVETAFTKFF